MPQGAEGGKIEVPEKRVALSGVEMGRGVPSTVVSSPSGVRDGNAFWRILKATERSFLHLYTYADIWGQGRGLG